MINIYEPNIKKYSSSAIDAINSGWISNHGIYVKKSTDKLKEILKIKNVILMANGTCATHCLFLALKYKYPELKKIYVSNNCYVAAWNSLLMEYSKENIEVLKMDLETWNINTDIDYINSLDKNAAVLIVHNLGNIINVPRLKRLRPDLIFIEDNCEGLFGKYEDIYSGTSEQTLCSSISFYGNKIITTGEGGAFLTNDDDIYNYIIKAYSQGLSKKRYLHDTHAYNYRMTNIQAAFLYDQLNDLDNILTNKNNIFKNYENLLENLIINNKIKLFKKEDSTDNAYWIFSIRIINNKLTHEELYNYFYKNNIDTRPFFYPINKHKHLSDINFNDEIPDILNNDIIMIPSSPLISFEEQKYIVECINKYVFLLDNNIEIININNNNKELLINYIPEIKSTTFRYFNKRNIDVIQNHKLTILLKDVLNEIIFGYVHIDYDEEKYWFGIYLHEEYQNKKIGSKIMNYVFNLFEIKNLNEIYLTVDNNNYGAIHLYSKYKFEEIKKYDTHTLMKKIN